MTATCYCLADCVVNPHERHRAARAAFERLDEITSRTDATEVVANAASPAHRLRSPVARRMMLSMRPQLFRIRNIISRCLPGSSHCVLHPTRRQETHITQDVFKFRSVRCRLSMRQRCDNLRVKVFTGLSVPRFVDFIGQTKLWPQSGRLFFNVMFLPRVFEKSRTKREHSQSRFETCVSICRDTTALSSDPRAACPCIYSATDISRCACR